MEKKKRSFMFCLRDYRIKGHNGFDRGCIIVDSGEKYERMTKRKVGDIIANTLFHCAANYDLKVTIERKQERKHKYETC